MNESLVLAEETPAALMEKVIIGGDLAKLTPAERLQYVRHLCNSLGLNWMTKPFQYIYLNGKLVLYANKDATEQLRKKYEVSVTKMECEVTEGVYVVRSYMTDKTGRTDISIGAVAMEDSNGKPLGEARANAMMKCETKSKRRGTLSICGLGMLDETEIETIPSAQPFEKPEPPKAELPPVTYNQAELELATAALQTLLADPVFSDTDRIACSQWLKKKPGLEKIKAKLAEKKSLLIENTDADVPTQAEGQVF